MTVRGYKRHPECDGSRSAPVDNKCPVCGRDVGIYRGQVQIDQKRLLTRHADLRERIEDESDETA